MDERERVSRLIAGALHAGQEDTIVSYGAPTQVLPGVYVVPPRDFRAPLWTLFTPAADIVMSDPERQQEAARARWSSAAPEMD